MAPVRQLIRQPACTLATLGADTVPGMLVSVAIPVLNGGALLGEVLSAVRAQALGEDRELELVVCDSGSTDGSVERCRAAGARVVEIPQREFSHGLTRNRLMEETRGEWVAFLTQDSVPASTGWLAELIAGFGVSERVGLVYGPYLPRTGASPMVVRELMTWFGSLSPDGQPRVDRLDDDERGVGDGLTVALTARQLYGPRPYFTDANGCISRKAWETVPFRDIAYAEDHALALDMLWAGYAKVFMPEAAVVHSHDYSAWEWLRRSFDEARAVREVYGYTEPVSLRDFVRRIGGSVHADGFHSIVHHGARALGAAAGGRAGDLTGTWVRRLSLENR